MSWWAGRDLNSRFPPISTRVLERPTYVKAASWPTRSPALTELLGLQFGYKNDGWKVLKKK